MNIIYGNKRYSSWSLRAWLAVRIACGKGGFIETFCPLAGAGASKEKRDAAAENIFRFSPTGKVPALVVPDFDITVFESLAIVLFVADQYPDSNLLPRDPAARALCLSASSEMHAGFSAIRENMPMNCCVTARRHGAVALARSDVKADIARLCTLWEGLRLRYGSSGGPFLFGEFSAADCMYAPVALRFRTYDPELSSLSPVAQEYVQALLACDVIQEWIHDAEQETERVPQYETTDDSLNA